MKIIRNKLRIMQYDMMIPSEGSDNVKLEIESDGSYSDYVTEVHVGYFYKGSPKEVMLNYLDGYYSIPGEIFVFPGPVSFACHLSKDNEKLVTNTLVYLVKAAPGGTIVLPSTETWEAAVNSFLESWSDQFSNRVNSLKNSFDNLNSEMNVLNSRMDTMTSLPNGSTIGDAELADIRVGFDGKTYESAGSAVRGQVSQLSNDLDNFTDISNRLKIKSENKYYTETLSEADYPNGITYEPIDIIPNTYLIIKNPLINGSARIVLTDNHTNVIKTLSYDNYINGDTFKLNVENSTKLWVCTLDKEKIPKLYTNSIDNYKSFYPFHCQTKKAYNLQSGKLEIIDKEDNEYMISELVKKEDIAYLSVNSINEYYACIIFCDKIKKIVDYKTNEKSVYTIDDITSTKEFEYIAICSWEPALLLKPNCKFYGYPDIKLKPTYIMLNFDNSNNGFQNRFNILNKYNYKFSCCIDETLYLNHSSDGILNSDMLEIFRKLEKNGIEITLYGGIGARPDIYSCSVDEWYNYVKPLLDFANNNGFFPTTYFAPNNNMTESAITALKKLGFSLCRCGEWVDGNDNSKLIKYMNDNRFTLSTQEFYVDDIDEVKQNINEAILYGYDIAILSHKIEDTPSDQYQVSTTDYNNLLEFIKSKGNLVKIITFQEYLNYMAISKGVNNEKYISNKKFYFLLNR